MLSQLKLLLPNNMKTLIFILLSVLTVCAHGAVWEGLYVNGNGQVVNTNSVITFSNRMSIAALTMNGETRTSWPTGSFTNITIGAVAYTNSANLQAGSNQVLRTVGGTNYLDATVGETITNGLASIAFVTGQGYTTPIVTNGLASIAYISGLTNGNIDTATKTLVGDWSISGSLTAPLLVVNIVSNLSLSTTNLVLQGTMNANNFTITNVAGIFGTGIDTLTNTLASTNWVVGKNYLTNGWAGALSFNSNLTVTNLGSKITARSYQILTNDSVTVGVGEIAWNPTDMTFDLGLTPNTTLQAGQEALMYARNGMAGGVTISNGSVCYLSGSTGERATVKLANASSSSTSKATIGIATDDIANGSVGFVTLNGLVRGLDTSAFTEGDLLYLATTDGAFTNAAPPPPNQHVSIGVVVKKNATTGSIFVSVKRDPSVEDLSNVAHNNLTTGDINMYWSNLGYWSNFPSAYLTNTLASTNWVVAQNYLTNSFVGNVTVNGSVTSTNIVTGARVAVLAPGQSDNTAYQFFLSHGTRADLDINSPLGVLNFSESGTEKWSFVRASNNSFQMIQQGKGYLWYADPNTDTFWLGGYNIATPYADVVFGNNRAFYVTNAPSSYFKAISATAISLAGSNITAWTDISGGGGDVYLANNQTFTGTNTFNNLLLGTGIVNLTNNLAGTNFVMSQGFVTSTIGNGVNVTNGVYSIEGLTGGTACVTNNCLGSTNYTYFSGGIFLSNVVVGTP